MDKIYYNGVPAIRDFDMLTDNVVSVLACGKYPLGDAEKMHKYISDTNGGDRVIAIIQFPSIDIELEAWTSRGIEPCYAADDDDEVMLDYFVCFKGLTHTGNEEWVSVDCLPCDVDVDFSASDWREQLEQAMCEALDEYVNNNGLSFTEYNFDDFNAC